MSRRTFFIDEEPRTVENGLVEKFQFSGLKYILENQKVATEVFFHYLSDILFVLDEE